MTEGTLIGRFKIAAELGHGGMGTVYRAEDPVIGRSVAIKIIRLDDTGPVEVQRQLAQSFLREIHTAGVLHHPGIVSIYDAGKQESMAYIVMELVAGVTFDFMLHAQPRPSLTTLLGVCRQAAAALDYAHSNGVIHRDIKPSNILVQENGVAKIVDFGIAKVAQASTMILSQTGMTMGTPDYMSPEQVLGNPLDGRTDQWSLAVVAYTALTGSRPFEGEHFTHVMGRIMTQDADPPTKHNPALPSAVDPVMARALTKDPSKRFGTCTEFITALEKACTGQNSPHATVTMATVKPSAPPPEPETEPVTVAPQPPPASAATRQGARWAIAGVVLLAVVGGGLMAWRAYHPQKPLVVAAPVETPPPVIVPKPRPSRTRTRTTDTTRTDANAETSTAAITGKRKAAPDAKSYSVRLVTTPPDAEITIDGKPESACKSPCAVELTSGEHTLRAAKDGFYPLQKSFNVESDQQEIPLALEQATGSLLVKTEPQGAAISADGSLLASVTPTTIRLPMGHHKITLTKDGYAPYTFEATVDDSLVHSTSVTLAAVK
jgi:serine/threonine-protein kinase